MSKANKILLILIIVLVVVLGGVLYWQLGMKKSYYAVYLSTGDLYFGKLSYFPRVSLSDVWFRQRGSNNPQNSLNLARFADAVWGPEDKIYFTSVYIFFLEDTPDFKLIDSARGRGKL